MYIILEVVYTKGEASYSKGAAPFSALFMFFPDLFILFADLFILFTDLSIIFDEEVVLFDEEVVSFDKEIILFDEEAIFFKIFKIIYIVSFPLFSAGDEQRAVWKGVQTQDADTCGHGAGRKVYMRAAEYFVYGALGMEITSTPNATSGEVKDVHFADHLGSTRATYATTGSSTATDYKPFGSTLWNRNGNVRQTFLGKEQDAESDLGDFGARKYDPSIGRFTSTDVYWAAYPSWTPYHYAMNSPISKADYNGMYTMINTRAVFEGISCRYTDEDYIHLPNPIEPGVLKDMWAAYQRVMWAYESTRNMQSQYGGGAAHADGSGSGAKEPGTDFGRSSRPQFAGPVSVSPLASVAWAAAMQQHNNNPSPALDASPNQKLQFLRQYLITEDIKAAAKGKYEISIKIFPNGEVRRAKGEPKGENERVAHVSNRIAPYEVVSIDYHIHPSSPTTFSPDDVAFMLKHGTTGTLAVLGDPWEFTAIEITDIDAAREWFLSICPPPENGEEAKPGDLLTTSQSDAILNLYNYNDSNANLGRLISGHGMRMYNIRNGQIK